jgi:hypothetical protein
MADTHDDNTGWTAFFTYLRWRADKIVPVTERMQEAERLIFYQIYREELELRWQDVDGREYIGLPRDWPGWFAYYDQSADAIRARFPYAPTLYQPQVRERRRKLVNPVDTTATDPQQVLPPPASSSPMSVEPSTSLANPEGREHRERDEPVEPTVQWPWRKDPALRQSDGSEPRRIQLECERRLRPSIQDLSPAKICEELVRAGVSNVSATSVRRAFGRK